MTNKIQEFEVPQSPIAYLRFFLFILSALTVLTFSFSVTAGSVEFSFAELWDGLFQDESSLSYKVLWHTIFLTFFTVCGYLETEF